MTEGLLAVTVCNTASPSHDVPISSVFLSSTLCSYLPLAFSLFFLFLFVCLFLFVVVFLFLFFCI